MLILSCFEIVSRLRNFIKLLKLNAVYLRVYRALIIVSRLETIILKN
ncbi:MAG: hypothetical protein MSH30_04295 [Campylobacter sp.]|nr:hypothetical protein [Campylobacter sp.]MCI6694113.1 hypothetical protein [Campylobacter sp.]MCI6818432.1 hypothetical protein [Campylobacter sp.]MCI7362532.1 hypothetical protein [Campylobacter sp.]MCI7464070.1 hypothetical protein [Campylobacter sp.]